LRTVTYCTENEGTPFNAFNARSDTTSAFTHLFVNPWLWGAIAFSLLLQVAVVDLEFLNLAFGTVPLEFNQWLLCAAMASVVVWYSELRKLVGRAWGRVAAAEGTPGAKPLTPKPAEPKAGL